MPYHTYILYSKRINRFYVGSTAHLHNRLLQHNNQKSKYTATGVPWILLWHTEKPTRLKAEKLECKLKNLARLRKVRFMLKYSEGVSEKELLNNLFKNSV